MQARLTQTRRTLVLTAMRRLIARLAGPRRRASPRPGDLPDYLRRDVGLDPAERRGNRANGPPLEDPFRLL